MKQIAMIRKASRLLRSSHKDKRTNARVFAFTRNREDFKNKVSVWGHHLQQRSLVSVSHSSHPLQIVSLSFISLLSFLTPSVLSLSVHDPLSSPPCLCMLPSLISFSLARNMNILELRSLKGTMKRPPSKIILHFQSHRGETFLSDERTGAMWVCLLLLHTQISLLFPAFMSDLWYSPESCSQNFGINRWTGNRPTCCPQCSLDS